MQKSSIVIIALILLLTAGALALEIPSEPVFMPDNFLLLPDIDEFNLDYALSWTDSAAGLFLHYQPFMKAGTMTREMQIEVVVALTTITLFIPCIANVFMIAKERGWRTAAAMAAFIFPLAFAVGGLVRVFMLAAGFGGTP